MPKIIANLEDTIIEQANIQLFEKGYSDMTMRSVAEACGIAVGTVYNYYKSKDMMVAKIMLRDWNHIIEDVALECSAASNIHEGFRRMYDGVVKFVEKYDPVWTQYGKESYTRRDMPVQFDMLISQLSEILNEILVRCHDEKDPYISVFLAEVLINTATKRSFEYDNISRVLHRMFD
ncbi:MAG: helix-turn-helix transcriptional regulator [Clostridia bacterium]|nr:helix-turn-helix transcriptional regulator [Clostridia bacterium]MBQ2092903.1 helix-turn-helix transcriptional regulator [Clostridia bacterium]